MAFDEVKATQAAAAFLRLAGNRLQYLALIKLLYKADREALKRWGAPITTDQHASLHLGPIVSHTYDLIKAARGGFSEPNFWSSHIATVGYDVEMRVDPQNSELAPIEEELIREIFATDGGKDGFVLSKEFHASFSEWRDPGNSSTQIELEEILAAVGASEDEVANAEAAVSLQRAARMLSA